jgi:hypothetical protein
MFLRQLAVALAAVLPLAAQVTEQAPLTCIDVVVANEKGERLRGLSAVDFEVLEGDKKLPIIEFAEYSPEGRVSQPVTDSRYVQLVTPPAPTPPRRVVLLADDATKAEAAQFAEARRRPGDVFTIDTGKGEMASRIAAAALQLARHPEKKAIVVYGDPGDAATKFAGNRGVAVVKPDQFEDVASYYSLGVRAGDAPVQVRTTRMSYVRTYFASARPLADDAIGDTVLAHHFIAPRSNELGITLATAPAAPTGPRRTVKLQVMVPIRNLGFAREGAEVTGGFDVLTSIGDGKGRFTRVSKQSHAIRWPAEALAQAGDRNITYSFDIVLEPGSTQISVGVVDQHSKKTGFQRIEVSG